MPRMPQYRAALFRRIRHWYASELSYDVVYDPVHRESNMYLLSLLAPFVARNKDAIADELHFSKLERKKFDYFAQGTVVGCRKCLKYYQKDEKAKKRKKQLKKLLKL